MITHSLILGTDDDDFPRRFVQIPSVEQRHTLAYGGNDGSISLIEGTVVKTARRFSERVCAVSASYDGKRVAVGFADGSTTIFSYANLDGEVHPFFTALCKVDGDEDFFSQIDGMDDGTSNEVSFPGPRFQTTVRSLSFDPRSCYLLACGSEDSGFCIVDATSSETLSKKRFLAEESACEHNETGVRSLVYHVYEKYALLASLDLQGRFCVWDVSGKDPELDYELLHKDGHRCVSTVDLGDINDSEPADQACAPVFGKTLLGLPGSNDFQLRSINAFQKQLLIPSINGEGHIEPIVSIAFSEDENHAITGGRDGRIVLWNINSTADITGRFLKVYADLDSICTHIFLNVSTIQFAFQNGTFASVNRSDILPSSSGKKSRDVSTKASETSAKTKETHAGTQNIEASEKFTKKLKASEESDDEVNFENSEGSSPSKPKVSFIDDEAQDDDDDDKDYQSHASITENIARSVEVGDNGSVMDEDDNYDAQEFEKVYKSNRAFMELPYLQPAFAPSSTPLDLQRRIMCWNHLGVITLLRGEEAVTRNTVNIDFTDSAFRRPISFTDNMDFIVGALGEDGALFATDLEDDCRDADDDDISQVVNGLKMSDKTKAALRKSHQKRMKKDGKRATGSSIYFHRFETFGSLSNKDWVVNLPDGELALGCAAGTGWAACITNRRYLRTFTSGGNQGHVIWLKGDPVTVVGRSRFVAIFYHEAMPMVDGTQRLGYTIYDGVSGETIVEGSLSCISSRASLSWAAFSKEGSLMVMDSDGMLSMLVVIERRNAQHDNNAFTWSWSPILDTVGLRKTVDDSFWPVTAQDGKLICVPLRGGNEHPDAARRPVTTALNFRMPFAYSDKSTGLEELSMRAKLALNQKKFAIGTTAADGYDVSELEEEYGGLCAQVDKVTLKLFMNIVETGKLERALDLVERLHLEKSFDIAITVADRMNHRNLSDKIEDVKDRRFAVEEKGDEELELEDNLFPDTQPETRTVGTPERSSSRNISPETDTRNKRQRDDEDDEEVIPAARRKINPFAKKRLESPARHTFSPAKSPSRVGISRLSSFSATSREMSKASKKLL